MASRAPISSTVASPRNARLCSFRATADSFPLPTFAHACEHQRDRQPSLDVARDGPEALEGPPTANVIPSVELFNAALRGRQEVLELIVLLSSLLRHPPRRCLPENASLCF